MCSSDKGGPMIFEEDTSTQFVHKTYESLEELHNAATTNLEKIGLNCVLDNEKQQLIVGNSDMQIIRIYRINYSGTKNTYSINPKWLRYDGTLGCIEAMGFGYGK